MLKSLLIASTLVATVASSASSQDPDRAFAVVLTTSTDSRSATQPCLSNCSGRDILSPVSLTTVELELARPLNTGRRMGFDYYSRFVPLAYVRGNPAMAATWNGAGWSMPVGTERSSTVGIGVEPLGARLWVGSRDVRVEGDLAAGIFGFLDPLLAANAARVNFAIEAGIGARIAGLIFGYRKHHISNAGFGEVNPGLDSSVIFLGFEF